MYVLKVKVVLCFGVEIIFKDEINNIEQCWCYQDGLNDYLVEVVNGLLMLLEKLFIGNFVGDIEVVDWVLLWLLEGGELLIESYVNFILMMQGGIYVNGLCQGLLDVMCEFCEYCNILLCGVKLLVEDIWDCCVYVLLVKMQDLQFVGQIKECFFLCQCVVFVFGVVKDVFILWLNQNVQVVELLVEMVIFSVQCCMCVVKKVVCKKLISGLVLSGKLVDCIVQDFNCIELFFVEGDFVGGFVKQVCDCEYQVIMLLKGKIFNIWEVFFDEVLVLQEVYDILVVIGIDFDSDDLSQFCYGKICIFVDVDFDGLYIVMLFCVLFVKYFCVLVKYGYVYVVLLLFYCIDFGKEVYYVLMEEEKEGVFE